MFSPRWPPAGSGNGTRSESSIREGAIEYVPQSNRENGLYGWHSSKEGWGVAPHFRSSSSERLRHAAQGQNVNFETIVPQIRSEDWFVTIDLKDAYFHISILPYRRKFLRFALGGRTYQYRVLPFCLALSPRTFTKYVDAALAPLCLQGIRIMNYIDDWLILAQSHQAAVRHRDVVLAHMKELGLRLNAKKSVLSPIEKGHFSWRGMRLNIDAGAPVTGTYRVHPVGCKKYKARPVTHCQTVSETVRSYGSSIQRDAFGLLYMRHMQWWPCDLDYVKRGCPSGKSLFT